MATTKIVLSYHKPDVLLKDDVLTPIHAGRARARQRMANDDVGLQWLIDNTIGDDTGDNISLKNASYNEMTTVYWAWKNYAALGDPDRIGFMHYRRHFLFKDDESPQKEVSNLEDEDYLETTLGYSPEAVDALFADADFVYTRPLRRSSVRDHFAENHLPEDLEQSISILRERFPQYLSSAENYLDGQDAIFCNMTILPKRLFFEYANFVFGILFELERRVDMRDKRMFVSEWLTGIFVTDLLARGLRGRALPMVIAEGHHRVPVVLAASPSFVLPLSVALTSLLESARPNTSYDVHILVKEEYPAEVSARLMTLVERYPGTTISFIAVGGELENVEVATAHVQVQTYYRLLIPSKLPHISRCIYLDADVVVERDLSPLLRTVVDDKYLAGVHAAGYLSRTNERAASVGLPSYDRYINAGVILMNLERIRRDGLESRFVELSALALDSDDQDVLNIACYEGIRILPPQFNVMTKYAPLNEAEFFAYSGVSKAWTRDQWEHAIASPIVIHYADKRKPWLDAAVDFADRWWHYAMLSPFRDQIVAEYLQGALQASQGCVVKLRSDLVNARGKGRQSGAGPEDLRSPRAIRKFQSAVIASARLERELRAERAGHKMTRRTLKVTRRTLTRVRASRSYKIGRAITAIPRGVHRLFTPSPETRPAPAVKPEVPTSRPETPPGASASSRRLGRFLARVAPTPRHHVDLLAKQQRALIQRSYESLSARQNELNRAVAALELTLGRVGRKVSDLAPATAAMVSETVTGETVDAVRLLVKDSSRETRDLIGAAERAGKERTSTVLNRASETFRAASEVLWSEVYHDTVRNSEWFLDRTLSPGRWAVGYPALYLLYRLLDEMRPKSILELGLGQSTRMIAQYVANSKEVSHKVVEHDKNWVRFSEDARPLPPTSDLVMLGLTKRPFLGDPEVLCYAGFREAVGQAEYDLIVIDGPFGGEANLFARIDVLDLIPDFITPRFAILLDDYDRPGEQRTTAEIRRLFEDADINVLESKYSGNKATWLATSADLRFFGSL